MARIHVLMEQSDQSKARKVMAGWFKDDELYDKRRSGGKTTLELFEFCELIVRITFNRANPKYGSVGNREVKSVSMPKVLEVTLKNDILPKAKRDMMREQVKPDTDVQAHFKMDEFLPETRHKVNGLTRMFEAKAYEMRKSIQELGIETISLVTLIIWMGPDFRRARVLQERAQVHYGVAGDRWSSRSIPNCPVVMSRGSIRQNSGWAATTRPTARTARTSTARSSYTRSRCVAGSSTRRFRR